MVKTLIGSHISMVGLGQEKDTENETAPVEKPKPKSVKRVDIKKKVKVESKVEKKVTLVNKRLPKLPSEPEFVEDHPLRADAYWSWKTVDQKLRDKTTGEIHHGFQFTLDADQLATSGIVQIMPRRDVDYAALERVTAL